LDLCIGLSNSSGIYTLGRSKITLGTGQYGRSILCYEITWLYTPLTSNHTVCIFYYFFFDQS
jgi:hypothetical protein